MKINLDAPLSTLAHASIERSSRWENPKQPWSLSDWGVALAGETGEVCDVIKKMNRSRDGMLGNTATDPELRADLANELADTLTYLILLANAADIDLVGAFASKYNEVSVRIGVPDRLMPHDTQDVFVYYPEGI